MQIKGDSPLIVLNVLSWIYGINAGTHNPKWSGNRTFYLEDFCSTSNKYTSALILLSKGGLRSSGFLAFSRSDVPNPDWTGNCSVVIRAPPGQGVVVAFRKISLGPLSDSYACLDYIQVSDGETSEPLSNPICGEDFYEPQERTYVYKSVVESNSVKITFIKRERKDEMEDLFHLGLLLTFTAFSDGEYESCNPTVSYLCHNKRCIAKQFLCDTHNNCGDLSDEMDNGICNSHHGSYISTASFVGILFAVLILILILFFVFMPRTQAFPCSSGIASPRIHQHHPGRVLTRACSIRRPDPSRIGIATVSVSVPFDYSQSEMTRQQFRAMGEPPPAYNNLSYNVESPPEPAVASPTTPPPPAYETVVRNPPIITRIRRSRSQ